MKIESMLLMGALTISAFTAGYWHGRDGRPVITVQAPVPIATPLRSPTAALPVATPIAIASAQPVAVVPESRPPVRFAEAATPVPRVTVTVYPPPATPGMVTAAPLVKHLAAAPSPTPQVAPSPSPLATPDRTDYDDDLPQAGPRGRGQGMGQPPGGGHGGPGSQWDGHSYPTVEQRPSNLPSGLAWPPPGWSGPPQPPPRDYAPYFPPPPSGGGFGPPGGGGPPDP